MTPAFLFIAVRVNDEEYGNANRRQSQDDQNGGILTGFFG
jgi:hypothetical protein